MLLLTVSKFIMLLFTVLPFAVSMFIVLLLAVVCCAAVVPDYSVPGAVANVVTLNLDDEIWGLVESVYS